jgi:hypothetical protein
VTFDLSTFAPGLERRANGIWFERGQAPVSNPEEGRAACVPIDDRLFWFRHRDRRIASVVRRVDRQGNESVSYLRHLLA